MIQLQVKKIVGTPENKGWVQAHRFTGMEKEKHEQRGEMILLLCLEGASEQTATILGREVISRVYEEYYGNLDGRPMERLKQMLDKVTKERPLYLTEKIKVSLSVVVFWQDCVYLGIRGGGAAFLIRNGKVLPLAKGSRKEALVVSGLPQENDLFFLGTTDFFSQVPEGTIRACLQSGSLETVVEVLSPLIHSRKDRGKIGVALAKVLSLESAEEQLQEKINSVTVPSLVQEKEKQKPVVLPVGTSDKLEAKKLFAKRKLIPRFSLPKIPLFSSFPRPTINRVVGIVLMIVLLGSVGWGWQKQKKLAQEKHLNELVSQAEEKLTAAESVKHLDVNHSLTLAHQAVELLSEAVEMAPRSQTIEQTKQRAEKLVIALGGGEKVKPDPFFDLGLLAEGAIGDQLICSGKKIFVLDLKTARAFAFGYPEKTSKVFIGGELLKDKKMFAVGGENKFYLLDDEGIVFWDGKDRQQRAVESQWQEPIDLDIWGSSLYVLDKKEEKLWKLAGLGKDFASPRDWFAALPSFAWDKVKGLAINGHIWILTEDGRVHRFFAGEEDPVNFDSSSISNGQLLTVAAESSRVAVLDKEGKLFVWDKEGKLEFQLNLEIETTDFALDPQGRWLFFLTNGEVHWLDLERFVE